MAFHEKNPIIFADGIFFFQQKKKVGAIFSQVYMKPPLTYGKVVIRTHKHN